jgi:hypothetical protein
VSRRKTPETVLPQLTQETRHPALYFADETKALLVGGADLPLQRAVVAEQLADCLDEAA